MVLEVEPDPFEPARYLGQGRRRLKASLASAGIRARAMRPCRVDYLPGRALTVTWVRELDSDWPARRIDRVVQHVSARRLTGAHPIDEDRWGNPQYVFHAASDPALPALAGVLDAQRLPALLSRLGVPTAGRVTSVLRGYQPLRRAVVDVVGAVGPVRLEVVPPSALGVQDRRHRLLRGSLGPVRIGCVDDGILAHRPFHGDSLYTTRSDGHLLLSLGSVESLLDRIPLVLVNLPGVPGPLELVYDHVQVLGSVAPAYRARLEVLGDRLGPFADLDPGLLVPTHGDLRPDGLLFRHGTAAGVEDVGTAGEGFRIDDQASLLGHIATHRGFDGSPGSDWPVNSWLREIEHAGTHPAALRSRIAAAVLAATSRAFQEQDPDWRSRLEERIGLAERWADGAAHAIRPTRAVMAQDR